MAEGDDGIRGDPDDFLGYVEDDMDIREIVDIICEIREDSKAPRELTLRVAELNGMEPEDATRYLKEFVSTVEIVELDDDYLQTRRFFDATFD